MIDGSKYTAEIRDGRGRVTWWLSGYDSHETAALAAFVARPKANKATTYRGASMDIREANRFYTIRDKAIRDGVESLPAELQDEAKAYLRG